MLERRQHGSQERGCHSPHDALLLPGCTLVSVGGAAGVSGWGGRQGQAQVLSRHRAKRKHAMQGLPASGAGEGMAPKHTHQGWHSRLPSVLEK